MLGNNSPGNTLPQTKIFKQCAIYISKQTHILKSVIWHTEIHLIAIYFNLGFHKPKQKIDPKSV